MKLALVGHGRMGREVAAAAAERGHEVLLAPRAGPFPAGCSVGIDFTRPEAVLPNLRGALAAGARYVVGTTGWEADLPLARRAVEAAGGGLVHAPNFSLGVQLYLRLVKQAAALLAPFPEYDPFVFERHHRFKRDAPSGTAKALAALLESAYASEPPAAACAVPGAAVPAKRSLSALTSHEPLPEGSFHVASLRAGGIVGDHTVGWDSGDDEIAIEHRARSRRAFANGAVLAAEWIAGRTGVFTLEDLIEARLAR